VTVQSDVNVFVTELVILPVMSADEFLIYESVVNSDFQMLCCDEKV
jgi:hypothetical protein